MNGHYSILCGGKFFIIILLCDYSLDKLFHGKPQVINI